MTQEEKYIEEHNLDEIDAFLLKEFCIIGGACSAQKALEYSTARKVAEKLWKQPVSEDLKEAAMNYTVEIKGYPGIANKTDKKVLNAFKAGWQAGQEQMMKDAIDAKVEWYDGLLLNFTQEAQDIALEKISAKIDDNVKLIIVKEE